MQWIAKSLAPRAEAAASSGDGGGKSVSSSRSSRVSTPPSGIEPGGASRASSSGCTAGCCSMLAGHIIPLQPRSASPKGGDGDGEPAHVHGRTSTAPDSERRIAASRASLHPSSGTTTTIRSVVTSRRARRETVRRVNADRSTSAVKLLRPAKSMVSSNITTPKAGPGDDRLAADDQIHRSRGGDLEGHGAAEAGQRRRPARSSRAPATGPDDPVWCTAGKGAELTTRAVVTRSSLERPQRAGRAVGIGEDGDELFTHGASLGRQGGVLTLHRLGHRHRREDLDEQQEQHHEPAEAAEADGQLAQRRRVLAPGERIEVVGERGHDEQEALEPHADRDQHRR